MKRQAGKVVVVLAAAAGFLVACQDDRGGFQQTAPRADAYVVAAEEGQPAAGDFQT